MNKRIIIGADCVPTESNLTLFELGDVVNLVGDDLLSLMNNSQFRIFNLEVPLSDVEQPIDKCGPHLIAPTSTVNGYKSLGIDLLSIANNHILDHGAQGFNSTVSTLKDAGIAYVGGGVLDDAIKPYFFHFNEHTVGVYACTEHEFSIATSTDVGANPFDSLVSYDHVVKMKENCDFSIVLYHGGKEHYRFPSPYLQALCRKFIDKGADLVICQHSHCIGCEEKYGNKTIVYGQGNFLFDKNDNEYWRTSLLISIDEHFNISYIPLVKQDVGVRIADKVQSERILADFQKRSLSICKKGFIENQYDSFSREYLHNYLISICCMKRGIVGRVINKLSKGKYLKNKVIRKMNKKNTLAFYDFISCEAHRELLLNGIKEHLTHL